jgi:hypothetical protein
VTIGPAEIGDLEAPVDGRRVDGLRGYVSVWADLLRIVQVLARREELPALTDDGPTLFTRSAMWDSAVITYGRCFASGTRSTKLTPFVGRLPKELQACHRQILAVRNTEVAHHDQPREDKVTADAVLDPNGGVAGIRLRVFPAIGPEDEPPFKALVSQLAHLVERKMQRLNDQIVNQIDAAALARVAVPHDPVSDGPRGRVRITFDAWLPPE